MILGYMVNINFIEKGFLQTKELNKYKIIRNTMCYNQLLFRISENILFLHILIYSKKAIIIINIIFKNQ